MKGLCIVLVVNEVICFSASLSYGNGIGDVYDDNPNEYVLDYKNLNSTYYKSIHISYPNVQDRANARKRGVSPGGDIMIHGQPNGWGRFSFVTQLFNRINGCIALSNSDMDAVWEAVDPGTPI